jgi:HK97 family phage major capsid protein
MANKGYDVSGFASGSGFDWRLRRLRDANGDPILDSVDGKFALYGRPLKMVTNGGFDKTEATLIGGEWDKLVIGIRQDISFQVFDQGVITDTTGAIKYNAMQQDGKVLRAVMRVGYAVPNPVKVLGGTYPFGVLRPVNASS